MSRDTLLVIVVGIAVINGMINAPAHLLMLSTASGWYPASLLPLTPTLLQYFSSLIISTGTLMISGIPAAIFERINGQEEATSGSMRVWIVAAAALTMPALLNLT